MSAKCQIIVYPSEGSSSGRCFPGEQRGPDRYPTTARMRWNKEVNKVVMECFYRSNPFNEEGRPIRGYRQRMFREWRARGMFDSTEQRICDQARAIRKNGWLSELELEMIKRKIEDEEQNEDGNLEDEAQSEIVNEETEIRNDQEDANYQVDDADVIRQDVNEAETNDVEIYEEKRQIVEQLKEMMAEGRTTEGIMFKNVDKKTLRCKTEEVNRVVKFMKTSNITQTNDLIRAAGAWVAEQLGLKKITYRKKNEPRWKRRIEGDIRRLKQEVNLLEREKKGELGTKKKRKLKDLEARHRIKRKGLKTVIEELKQKMIAKGAKVKRYEQRATQFRQNRLFNVDQKKIYTELNGGGNRSSDVPGAEESRRFWGDIWSVEKEHDREARWLKDLKNESNGEHRQEMVRISVENVQKQCRKIPNWKAPGKDGVQGYWIKNLSNLHMRIAYQLNKILGGEDYLPTWMTYGRTILCQKDPAKGNAVENYRPITCLPLMWKLLTGMIAEEMYTYLHRENLLPEEQKGCRRGSRGTKDQLLIDKTVLRDCRRRHTNLAMAWIDYKKAYDFVPHSWISECMEMFGIAENVRNFLLRSMDQWKLSLTSNGEDLGDVHVKRGIFQGDSLSPLLFVLSMIPLSLVLRKVNACYEWEKKEYKLNHLLFMDDLKLFGKNEEQIDSLVSTVHIFSTDIGMEFALRKCGVVTLKRGKIARCEGVELPDGEVMKEVGQEGYTYLGMVELDKIKENEMKVKMTKEYKRRLRLIHKSKLNGRNKITAMNTRAVAIFRYGAGILEWKGCELKSLDRTTRKTMTMYGAFHPKSDVDRLYLKRHEGGRGLISIEHCVRGEENSLGLYVMNSAEKLIQGIRTSGTIETEGTISKSEFKRHNAQELKQKWTEKRMYGQFIRETPEKVDKDKTWNWLVRSDLKVETEALLCAAQEQAIRTNYVKHHIDKSTDDPLCRMCGKRGESVQHIISECEKLAQKEYKRRHDNVAKKIHWELCKKNGLEHKEKWYEHNTEGVAENEGVKVLWDMNIQCDNVIEARRPDIVIIDKKEKSCIIVDVAVPADVRVHEKEREKVEKYQDLRRETGRLWQLRKVHVVPVVVGALGSVTKEFDRWMEKLGVPVDVGAVQKTALLGTARILRMVLEM